MKEIFVQGYNLPETYHKAILALEQEGDILTCNDWNQKQKEVCMTFVVDNPLAEPLISRLYIGGFRELQQYEMEILDGILDFKIGDGWDYTYHNRMTGFPIIHQADSPLLMTNFNQIQFVVDELKRNCDTRRAVINIRDNSIDPFSTDPACLQNIQYFIRDNKLHCKVLMRSNDAVEATFMNAYAFVRLQEDIAARLGIEIGTYTHRANSFHCYEKDFKLLEQYVDGILHKPFDEITYEYETFYKELMEESIPEIQKMVDELKNK